MLVLFDAVYLLVPVNHHPRTKSGTRPLNSSQLLHSSLTHRLPQENGFRILYSTKTSLPKDPAHSIMAQNNQAREQVEIAMSSILIRTPSVVSRFPDDIINNEEMLTTRELSMFIDLARLENQVEHRDAELVPSISDWRRFWRLVFRRWNTTHPDNESPMFIGDLSSETAVKVGTLVCSQPPNKAYPGPQQPKWRQAGADVFLGVSIPPQQGWLELLWKDSKGKPVKPSIVKLDMELYKCLDLAISRYDRCVQDRVEKYNEDCIVATARRRLVHFAKVGTISEPRLLAGDEAPNLLPVVLAGDRADNMANTFANLKDLRDRRAN